MTPTPKVIMKVSGGLGNQLFQYSAARALSLDLHVPLQLDVTFYARDRHRQYLLNHFPIKSNLTIIHRSKIPKLLSPFWQKLTQQDTPLWTEKQFHFDPSLLAIQAPVRIEGYLQSPLYFARHEETIRQELQPPKASDPESLDIANEMAGRICISLHIRRGDYITSPGAASLFAECTMTYYQSALERMPENTPVFVFSDDILWAKNNLAQCKGMHFVGLKTTRPPLADLWLMSKATHHIIANSTFSWWGAWLANQEPQNVIAPAKWFKDPDYNIEGLLPAGWQRLKTGSKSL